MAERLLIVDDELDMLLLLKMILTEKTAYEVVTTPNPLEVEHLFSENPFQLVITDLIMPGRDGIEVIEVVKKRDPSIPVIIITAFGSIESAVEATKKGAFDYITKPFRKDRILLSMEKALEQRRNLNINQRYNAPGEFESGPAPDLYNLTYDQAKETALDRFRRQYFQNLFERFPGDLTSAAKTSALSEEALKQFYKKELGIG
ncbi:MAG: response regulator [Thermodesulfobacteriota bacterium]